jgi:hypothetical protein
MGANLIGQPEVKLDKDAKIFPSADEVVVHEGEIEAVLEWTITRADGSVRERKAKRSESFTRQFLDLLRVQMQMTNECNPLEIRDTTNVLRLIAISHYNFAMDALVNDDSYSMKVGTGSTAPTITDYVMEVPIAHGSGAGQLQHSLVTFGAPTSSATQSYFTITRNFVNSSGGSITVNEAGIYVKADVSAFFYMSNANRKQYKFLIIRDVIAGGIVVLNGETLTLNYRLLSVA